MLGTDHMLDRWLVECTGTRKALETHHPATPERVRGKGVDSRVGRREEGGVVLDEVAGEGEYTYEYLVSRGDWVRVADRGVLDG